MKYLRLLGVALAAIFAVAVVAVTAASALENPEILPNPTTASPVTFTGTGTAASLNSGVGTISSTSTTVKGEFTSAREGKVGIDFLKALSSSVPCLSTGDEKGTILVSGGAHLVDILPGGVLTLGIAVTLPSTLLIKCGTLSVEVTGTAIGQVDGIVSGTKYPAGTNKSILFHSTKPKTGLVQEFKTCDLDKAFCEGKTYQLLASFGTGLKEAAQEQEAEISFNKEVSIDY